MCGEGEGVGHRPIQRMGRSFTCHNCSALNIQLLTRRGQPECFVGQIRGAGIGGSSLGTANYCAQTEGWLGPTSYDQRALTISSMPWQVPSGSGTTGTVACGVVQGDVGM